MRAYAFLHRYVCVCLCVCFPLVLVLWSTLTDAGGMCKGISDKKSRAHSRSGGRPRGPGTATAAQGAFGKVSGGDHTGFGSHVESHS